MMLSSEVSHTKYFHENHKNFRLDSSSFEIFIRNIDICLQTVIHKHTHLILQWHSYTGAHWGTGPTISFCGPTINILTYHVQCVHKYTYTYTLYINFEYLAVKVHLLVSLAVGL